MGSDPKLTRRMGCMVPSGPMIYEIAYMGRRMKVQVNRGPNGELLVYGVPGHPTEGLPLTDFDGFTPPRIDDSRRSYTANLSVYDRACSRMIAGLTALRAAMEGMDPDEMENFRKRFDGTGFMVVTITEIDEQTEFLYTTVSERVGVEKAVKERLDVWSIEDRDGIPLPSYGPGAPPEGKDVNGRDL